MKFFRLSLIILLLKGGNALAQEFRISGRTVAGGEGLGFVYILVKNTGGGTSTNAEGYFEMHLPPGQYQLQFRFLGFKTVERTIDLYGNVNLEVEMLPVAIELEEVRAYGGGENPAFSIMKKAIERKSYFISRRQAYRSDAYTKGFLRIDELPKRLLGVKVPDKDLEEFMENGRKGIVYLSETVSEIQFKPPRSFHEEIKSSVVSGKDFDYSLNQARVLQIDLYENLVLRGMNERGFLSPFAPAAFTYYTFRLEGAHYDGKYLINRIAVIPRAKNEPLFRGHVYVVDSSWALYGANLYLTKDAGLDIIDTLRLEQNMMEPRPDLWLPASIHLSNNINVLSIKASGYLMGVFSNYEFETLRAPDAPKPKRGEVMRIQPDANEKDSLYWAEIRPIPLLKAEIQDYAITDSIIRLKNDPVYKDSTERANNKFRIANLLIGTKTISWDKSGITLQLQGLAEYRAYNTVEGIAISLSPSITYKYKKTAWVTAQPFFRYGFGNHMFHLRGIVDWQLDVIKLSSLRLDAGQHPLQFNGDEPIGNKENNLYTLFGQNFLKLYLSRFVRLTFRRELTNGLTMTLGAAAEHNYTLRNTSDFSFMPDSRVHFTSNNPLDPDNETDAFAPYQVVRFSADFSWKPKQRFVSYPDRRYRIERKNIPQPFVGFTYVPKINEASPEYRMTRAGFDWPLRFGLAGVLNLHVASGAFQSESNSLIAFFPEWKHFNGNQTVFWNDKPGAFRVLPYYNQLDNGLNTVISEMQSYFQVNAMHRFHGFLLNKIPLLKKLGWEETFGFNYLLTSGLTTGYYEIGGGIENIGLIPRFPGFLAIHFYAGMGGGLNPSQRLLFKIGF